MTARRASGAALLVLAAALATVSACDRSPPRQRAPAEPPEQGQAAQQLPPAIISPVDSADPAEPPSYEVAIASAAADREQAKRRCAEKSERLRAMCEADADAAYESAEGALQDLRGNQE
jgi:hypothetical protein